MGGYELNIFPWNRDCCLATVDIVMNLSSVEFGESHT